MKILKIFICLVCFIGLNVNAQDHVCTSRINTTTKSMITLVGDTISLKYHRIFSNACDADQYSFYDLSDLEPTISDSKNIVYTVGETNDYWLIPFDDREPTNLKNTSGSYMCCGGCSPGYDCIWYGNPTVPGPVSMSCICRLGQGPYGCEVTYHPNKATGGLGACGIIVKSKTIVVY
ncbi:MAG: hypothetical protein JNK61_03840 [Bacteroidia bacterium]|nr:hypothetical protein [Bacteroidia bacterium]